MSLSSAPALDRVTRRAFVAGALALLGACSRDAPPPTHPNKKIWSHGRLDPAELFPADLDLVMRVDVGRMRSQLGPAAESLAMRAEAEMDERLIAKALGRARVVWVGLRLAHLDDGDRLLVVEGDIGDLEPDPALFSLGLPPIEGVRSFDRRGRLRRPMTARILTFGERAIAFISPAEVDSVARVLAKGPDGRHRDPSAEGLVSADLRPRRLPPSLERRFPSLGAVVRGIERARANATIEDDGIHIEGEIIGISAAAAERADDLLSVLRESGSASRYADLFLSLKVERVDRTVRLRWVLPPEVLSTLVASEVEAPPVQGRP